MLYLFLSLIPYVHAQSADIVAAFQRFNPHAKYSVPAPTAKEQATLKSGKVVTRIDRPIAGDPAAQRALGMMISKSTVEELWVACQDTHFTQQESTKELRVSITGDRAVWYGLLDLPWPLSDRHWLLNVWNNHTLAAATNNRAWEHPWELIPNGPAKVRPHLVAGRAPHIPMDEFEDAIYTPMNQGAWVILELEAVNSQPRSLLLYHAMTKIGGSLPQGVVTDLVISGYEEMLSTIVRRAETNIHQHYNESHPPMLGGDGKPLDKF